MKAREVHKGDLIAEIDPAEWITARDSAEANIHMLENKVISAAGHAQLDRRPNERFPAPGRSHADVHALAARAGAGQSLARSDHVQARHRAYSTPAWPPRRTATWPLAAMQASDAAVKSLEDQVRAAEAQVAVAHANRKQVDVQQSDLAATRAQLQQARADKATADVHLGYTKIYAPLDGIVSVRAARQGEVLQVGEPIVTILDVDHLWVQADVEETYIDRVGLNQRIKVQLPSGNILDGTVIFKGVESDFATQRDVSRTKRDIKTFAIKVAVPNHRANAHVRDDRHGAAAAASLGAKLVAAGFSLWRVRPCEDQKPQAEACATDACREQIDLQTRHSMNAR